MTKRYYCATLLDQPGLVCLDDAEALHATRVMRVRVGESVVVFDGLGNEAEGQIATANRKDCSIDIAKPQHVDREPALDLTLAIALPKPDRAKEMIERLTEIGVKRVCPIVCNRTQRPPTDSLLEKLRRIVVEACKQSQRNVLMQIDNPIPIDQLTTDSGGDFDLSIVAHTGGGQVDEWLAANRDSRSSVRAAIGPEGGFSEDEFARLADAGFVSVGLGQRILRIETAAVVIASKTLV